MLLAIDVGNTNTVFSLFQDIQHTDNVDKSAVFSGRYMMLETWRVATSTSRTADEYAAWLHQMLRMRDLREGSMEASYRLNDIKHCVISTVVPQSLFHMRNLSKRHLNVDPLIIDSNNIPVGIRIDKPSEVGADRLVNTVAAHAIYGGPCIVVDSGTATNFDIVDEDGAFIGGLISPGINLSVQALHDAAARLPKIAIQRTDKIIGTDTVGAMQSGVFWGYVSLIEGLITRIKDEYAQTNSTPMTVIGTGGISSLFDGHIDAIDHFDAELTIRGLVEIFVQLQKA